MPGAVRKRVNRAIVVIEEEVAAIFERAAEGQAQQTTPQLRSGAGMTLTDLQEIGREVGIAREQLAEAAKAIELGGRQTSREFLGLPVVLD